MSRYRLATPATPRFLVPTSFVPYFTSMTTDSVVVEQLQPRFRYLDNPEAYQRDMPLAQIPGIGDFVVFAIDPVASVAHLDKVARQAARKIKTRRHVGLVMMVRV